MKDFLEYLIELWRAAGYPEIAGFITFLIALMGLIGKLTTTFWKQRKQRKQLHDLHPFYTEQEKLDAIQYYIETQCQTEAPSKKDEPGIDPAPKEEVISFFINKVFKLTNKESSQFYFILGGSGMGKTTFLINLYLRYINQFVKPPYHIHLFPLGYPNIDEKIENIKDQENTILLLDAFDEDIQAVHDYTSRLQTIIKLVFEFRKVVITCRTQFFPSEEEEPKETGVLRFGPKGGQHVFRKLYLSPFDDSDIHTYLKKRFPWLQRAKRRQAQQIVLSCPNLMVRPMLLSYIGVLLQSQQTYTSTYAVYAELINKWIERESDKMPPDRQEHYAEELHQFSREIALDLYRHRTERQGSLMMNSEEIQLFADRHGIRLEKMYMKSKSLLNRNAQGDYKFSHKSILEYFLAEEAFFNPDFRSELDFEGMSQAKAFFDEMVWEKLTVPFFSRGDVEGQYTLKNGKSRIITKLPEKILADITTLTLPKWDTSNDLLVFSGLPSLKRVEVTTHQSVTIIWAALRSQKMDVPDNKKEDVFGLDKNGRPLAYIANGYEDRGEVVFDHATGLMWQQSGFSGSLNYQDTLKYVEQLNQEKFAGYNDWRLPTIPELMSLIEPETQSNDLYINPIFDKKQRCCWSADRRLSGGSSSAAWLVRFNFGDVYWRLLGYLYYVRAVRS